MNTQERAKKVVEQYCKKTGYLTVSSQAAQVLEALIVDAIEQSVCDALQSNQRPVKLSALTEFERKFADYLGDEDDEEEEVG